MIIPSHQRFWFQALCSWLSRLQERKAKGTAPGTGFHIWLKYAKREQQLGVLLAPRSQAPVRPRSGRCR